jgi:hypothetical protein
MKVYIVKVFDTIRKLSFIDAVFKNQQDAKGREDDLHSEGVHAMTEEWDVIE